MKKNLKYIIDVQKEIKKRIKTIKPKTDIKLVSGRWEDKKGDTKWRGKRIGKIIKKGNGKERIINENIRSEKRKV